jgi:hypothetical protein
MDLDSLIELMEADPALLSGQYSSWISFNDLTADFISTFYRPDVEQLTPSFTDNGKTSFKYKVEATIPGSTNVGPANLGTGNLPSAEFEVVVLSNTVVEDCVNNKLTIGSRTVKDNTERPDKLEHQIAVKDTAGTPTVIMANTVASTVDGCTLATVFEWKDLNDEWHELRDNSFITTDFSAN